MISSAGQRWWLHHIMNTRAYLEAALAGDAAAAMKALQGLWSAAQTWQILTRSWVAGVLMGEHTVLAKQLIDGFARKAGSGWAASMAEALGKNVESTRKLFPRKPEEFAALFAIHTDLAGAYITDLVEGNGINFERHFGDALKNGRDLSAFTDRVFGLNVPR